jgi:uncharacterized radical SAM protein YgiQ
LTHSFLPVSQKDMEQRDWDILDFLFISADAYVDHPSFGHAIITRILDNAGFKVGIIPQPEWRDTKDFARLGRPRLGVLVSAGNLDSMLNKLTASKKSRSTDSYSPGGKAGQRPDRATIAYCNRIRELWGNIPLIIGGIEASLRRFAHYDYWSDAVRRSILIDSQADLLVYGMGEKQIIQIAELLKKGIPVSEIRDIHGTCYKNQSIERLWNYEECPSFESVVSDKAAFAEAFRIQYIEQDPVRGKTVVQRHDTFYVIQNPPAAPLSTSELDSVYQLPYTRTWHPMYEKDGGVPALKEVEFSLTTHRGCFGSCAFCAITSHQGRIIQSRSEESIMDEAILLTKLPGFKGYIHDVGGPTANFNRPSCDDQLLRGTCKNKQCIGPVPCGNLRVDHEGYLELLHELRTLPGVKKVFIRSGIRFDYLLADKKSSRRFLEELCRYHVSGQLKVAPEHVSENVLALMGKSGKHVYEQFMKEYENMNKKLGKKQYLVPYFISSHPGAGLKEAIELAEFVRDLNFMPEQVQDFIPTPGSLATCMYYTGINPLTKEAVYVPKSSHERKLQRALLQYRNPSNHRLVREALKIAGREDLIGWGEKCLVPPEKKESRERQERREKGKSKRRH